MSAKAVLRFIIGCFIAALILVFLLPAIGVPKSYLMPPSTIYSQAKGKVLGYVNKKNEGTNPNPFRNSEMVYYLHYQFRAPVPRNLVEKPTADEEKKKKVYHGRAAVDKALYDAVKVGDQVKIRFEETRPNLSGVDQTGGGLDMDYGGNLFGTWMLFVLGILILGYAIAPLLQRVILREDY